MQFDLFNHDVFIVPTQNTESDHVMFLFKILLVLYSFQDFISTVFLISRAYSYFVSRAYSYFVCLFF